MNWWVVGGVCRHRYSWRRCGHTHAVFAGWWCSACCHMSMHRPLKEGMSQRKNTNVGRIVMHVGLQWKKVHNP